MHMQCIKATYVQLTLTTHPAFSSFRDRSSHSDRQNNRTVRRLHQTAIGASLLLHLLILLNVVSELVHLTLLVLGLLLALLVLLLALPTGLALVFAFLVVMVENALHKVLVVGLVGFW